MEPALEEIRGQRSAHSLATGPLTAEPFISPLLLTITPALSCKERNECVVLVRLCFRENVSYCFNFCHPHLEIDEDTLLAPKTLALADDDSRHNLFAELGLSLLDGGHDHVTRGGLGVPVKASSRVTDGNNVEVFSSSVIGAVDHGGVGETSSDLVLDAGGKTASTFSFLSHVF